MPPEPPTTPDPITSRSLSGPIMVSGVLLILALCWALYDEAWGSRPWKSYQRHFVQLYTAHLKKLEPAQAAMEKQLRESPEAIRLEQQANSAEEASAGTVSEIDAQLNGVRRQLGAMQKPFLDTRARVAALEYQLDHTTTPQGKESIRGEIDEARREGNFDHLQQVFDQLKSREAELSAQRVATTKPSDELRARLAEYLNQKRDGPAPAQIAGLLNKVSEFQGGIRQIYVEESGLVDRCESCHLGIREPVQLTVADMGGQRVFVSHPDPGLLAIHDPARFGCSPCHNGNGLAVSSVTEAHGNNAHWDWPLFSADNRESGCPQCHVQDRVLDQAPLLNRGKDLFALKGCAACHRFQGFDRDTDALADTEREIRLLIQQQQQDRLERDRETGRGDQADTTEETKKHYAAAEVLLLKASQIDARVEALEIATKSLQQDIKQAGPNLKDIRLKLRKHWIPQFLKDPQAISPGTKMPRFRLNDSEVRALAAFIWQAGWDSPAVAPAKPGNAAKGKELFETRGCLACHSIGEGNEKVGGEFAANLTRLGQKANYDYIVRWIRNPRQRTRPYCPREQRDLTPEDYARHGQAWDFDLERSKCPNDGAELQVQNMTVMPNFRLSMQEAQDLATYLMSLSGPGAAPPGFSNIDPSYMDDAKLAAAGRALVSRYGCADCHEIQGFENSRPSATELTTWASKPIEQLDFGVLEGKAKREGWYSSKGFVEHKLRDPAVYDQGREKAPRDRLKMPDIQLAPDDLRALTTFMLGSLDTPSSGAFRTIPDSLRYNPTGAQKDIQDGWWLIKKYNCMGCHPIGIGQKSVLNGLAHYQDPDYLDQLPPSLIEEGARVTPDWLGRFLSDPTLGKEDTDTDGVRTYLQARMPTFDFSGNEVAILVRFFEALSGQPAVAPDVRIVPLNDRERQAARALFTSSSGPCLQCHLYGDPAHDKQATAPNFLQAKDRLKPGWTLRWLLDPQQISPGTAMPSELFRREGDRWVLAGEIPADARNYAGDHAQLLVRYMLTITPEEQRRLIAMMPRRSK